LRVSNITKPNQLTHKEYGKKFINYIPKFMINKLNKEIKKIKIRSYKTTPIL